ncbi:MAG: RNA 3'-terminal phosphate cyclase [Candidatus Baldrarchaeia archaeon]
MIKIDGSQKEGGGQILRYSCALSAILSQPIEVFNIRAKRSNPGLRAQHITAVKLIGEMVDAQITGLSVGSMKIQFIPRSKPKGKSYFLDVGTAGSTALVLQAALPVATFADNNVKLRLIGGTSVRWAPPMLYFKEVLLPLLEKFGVKAEINIEREGYYPKGGGIIEALISPSDRLSAISLDEYSEVIAIRGVSYCTNLPAHVAERQARSAEEILKSSGFENVEIIVDPRRRGVGTGSGIVLWAVTDQGIVGGDALGEKGKRAEVVGREAAEKLIKALKTKSPIDEHALDNLIIYMALADGESRVVAPELTLHADTAIDLCKMIVGAEFKVIKRPQNVEVVCKGIGFSRD